MFDISKIVKLNQPMNYETLLQIVNILSLIIPTLLSGIALIATLKLNLFPSLNYPVDFGLQLGGSRLFGDNKTFKGVAVFVIVSTISSYILHLIYINGGNLFIHPVFKLSLSTGLIYSLSYVFGELVNSAVKRRLRIQPGSTIANFRHTQMFFDLSDGIIFTGITLTLLTVVKAEEAALACIFGIIIHILTDKAMQKLHLKKQF